MTTEKEITLLRSCAKANAYLAEVFTRRALELQASQEEVFKRSVQEWSDNGFIIDLLREEAQRRCDAAEDAENEANRRCFALEAKRKAQK